LPKPTLERGWHARTRADLYNPTLFRVTGDCGIWACTGFTQLYAQTMDNSDRYNSKSEIVRVGHAQSPVTRGCV